MKLHNTLTKQVDAVKPLKDNQIRIYSCGPTVYDHAHIGNLCAYIFADTLRRVVKASGFQVKQVMNYTDIDDKTIQRSQQKYPNDDPLIALSKLTDYYIELFRTDMGKIGNDLDSITFVRATDSIPQIKKHISVLLKKGFAYLADDGVYFSIDAYRKSGKKYGQLSEITDANTSEERIRNDEYDKESVHDFALWKIQKANEPAWDYELDGKQLKGRPGWHIECSVMSQQQLGLPFDIHTGGIDLIFPHHENEIAQSTAPQQNPTMATIFAHNNHILVDGNKMAKSAKNFYTLEDIQSKHIDPLAFRIMVLQTHYRNQVHFSWGNLEAAQNRLNAYRIMADCVWQPSGNDSINSELIADTKSKMFEAFQNDLDTPKVLEQLSQIESGVNNHGIFKDAIPDFKNFLIWVDELLGLNLNSTHDITESQKSILKQRHQARENNNFSKADELRDELSHQNIEIRDTPDGQIWSRS